ncbi:gp40 [Escherichia phage phiEB49]|uniref:Gp40 n=1 Tax=Escherichia phage phiEB49 TaxID=1048207 RepID=F8UBV0_9CAUD|nr:HNH endonuclease [Escherichia phage phiEB49]AEI91240.1 gp40 [Escherichia phage phiEB49]
MNWNDIFEYRDGVLYWKVKPRYRTNIGDIVGAKTKQGYITVSYMKNRMLAHRLIWEMHNGPIPEGMQIDHINHVRTDNRIENLRVVTIFHNNQNLSISKRNKSGCVGVEWHKAASKWCASIHANGKKYYLGIYENLEDAIKVRRDAEVEHGFHKNHGSK